MPRLNTLRALYVLIFVALGVYLPFFPRWLEARGVTGLAMGAASATLPAMSVLGPPLFGVLADVLRLRGWVLRVACGGTALGFAALAALAWDGAAVALAPLVVVTLFAAFFRSPVTLIADVLTMEHAAAVGTTYPRVRLWGSAGFLLAAVAAGRWMDCTSRTTLPLTVALAMAGATLIAFALPGRAPSLERPSVAQMRALARSPDVRAFLLVAFLSQVAHSAYDLCFSLHLRDLGVAEDRVGIAWAIGVVAEVALMASSARLFARASSPRLLSLGLLGAALRWTLLGTVQSPALLLALQPLHAASFALVWIASLAYTKGRVAPHLLATSQGLFLSAVGAGGVTGMLVWGPLYRARGGGATFGAAAVVACTALLAARMFARLAAQHATGAVAQG